MNDIKKVINRKEILKCKTIVQKKADEYSTQVLVKTEDGSDMYGSGIHIEFKETIYLITCEHVVRKAKYVFANPPITKDLLPRIEQDGKRYACNIMAVNRKSDIAVLNYSRHEDMVGAIPFNIDNQVNYTNQIINSHIGLAVYIHGVPKFNMEIIELSNSQYLMDSLTYTAIGGVTKASNDWIQCDFAEKEAGENPLINLDDDFLELSGGSRDIKGMSGSGLWCFNQGNILTFLGLLSHKDKSNIDNDQHLINFVPVWKILIQIKKLTNKVSSK